MVYFNIVLGIVTVLVSAGLAVYYSRPRYQQEAPHQRRRFEDASNNGGSPKNKYQRDRKSKPGDYCPICTCEMQSDNMHEMHCGHALHNACFQEFRYLRRDCLLCNQAVNLSLPGDDCTICLDPLTRKDMVHLPCQHALHNECTTQFIASGGTNCPMCRASM